MWLTLRSIDRPETGSKRIYQIQTQVAMKKEHPVWCSFSTPRGLDRENRLADKNLYPKDHEQHKKSNRTRRSKNGAYCHEPQNA